MCLNTAEHTVLASVSLEIKINNWIFFFFFLVFTVIVCLSEILFLLSDS